MSDLTTKQLMMMEVDTEMVEIFQSWFAYNEGLDEEELQEMMFLHFRMAFVAGRRAGREDMRPLIEQHAQDLRDIGAIVREM
jgi:hypothetical protein